MRAIIAMVAVLALSGCAFTVHDVKLDYRYEQPLEVSLGGTALRVGNVVDSRGVANPRMLMNMTNLNGDTTSGGWQAEKPLNEIVREGLVQALGKAGVAADGGSGAAMLTGELIDFQVQTIMGMWEGTLSGKMTAKFQIARAGSGEILWKDTVVGSSQVKGGQGAAGAFKATLDDLLTKLLKDDFFRQKVATAPSM